MSNEKRPARPRDLGRVLEFGDTPVRVTQLLAALAEVGVGAHLEHRIAELSNRIGDDRTELERFGGAPVEQQISRVVDEEHRPDPDIELVEVFECGCRNLREKVGLADCPEVRTGPRKGLDGRRRGRWRS